MTPGRSSPERDIQILHVDDDAQILDLVESYVEQYSESMTIRSATSGIEALNRLDGGIDCVLSDYRMPRMNGLELLEHLRRTHPDLPFILYTGEGSESLASRAVSAGVTDYIPKDTGRDHISLLLNRIRNAVEQYRAKRRAEKHERTASMMREIDRTLATTRDRSAIEAEICTIIAGTDPFTCAWIGGPPTDDGASPVRAVAGRGSDIIADIGVTGSEPTAIRAEPIGSALERGRPATVQLLGAEGVGDRHREAALDRGFHSVIALPLRHDGTDYGVLAIYSDRGQPFDARERTLLAEVADGVAQGLHRVQLTAALERERAQTTAIAEALADSIHVFDASGRCRRVYRGDPHPFDSSTDEVVGSTIGSIVPESVRPRVESALEAVVTEGTRRRVEFCIEDDGAGRRWFETSFAPLDSDTVEYRGVVAISRDVTERKRRELEARSFWRAVEHAGHSVYRTDADAEIKYVNPAFEEITGYDASEAIGETPSILKSGEHDEEYYEELWDTITAGEVWEGRVVNRRKDGETYIVNQTIAPVFGPEGTIEEFVAINADVTEQEARRKELARARRKYRALLDGSPDAMLLADPTTAEIVEVNGTATELLGRDHADLVGKSITTLHPPEEADRYRTLFDQATAGEQAAVSRFPNGDPVCIVDAHGDRVPVEIKANRLEFEGESLLLGSFRDLRDQLRRETALTRLHDVGSMLLGVEDVDRVCDIAGDAAIEALNFDFMEVEFRDDRQAYHRYSSTAFDMSDDDEAMAPNPTGIDARRPSAGAVAVEAQQRESEVQDMAEIQIPLEDVGVMNLGKVGTDSVAQSDRFLANILGAHLLTALQRIEYERELRRRNEHLDSFARTVAHDLRNPLSIASGQLELLEAEGDWSLIDDIQRAHRRMEELIDDLLALARAGKPIGEDRTTVTLRSVAKAAWEVAATEGARIEFGPDTDLEFEADRSRLTELLENLFTNAATHAGPSPTVTVGVSEDGFFVADDGTGIPPSIRDSILEKGVTTADEGTGLGLYIAKTIAEAHGWELTITESRSGGARIELTNLTKRQADQATG